MGNIFLWHNLMFWNLKIVKIEVDDAVLAG